MSDLGHQRPKRSRAKGVAAKASARAEKYKNPPKATGEHSTKKPAGKKTGSPSHQAPKSTQQKPSKSKNPGQQRPGNIPGANQPGTKKMHSPRQGGHIKGSGVRTRRLAANVLARIERQEGWATPILDEALNLSDLDQRDKAFVSNLVFSAIRMQGSLDAVLNEVLNTPVDQLDPQVRATLRVGTWELLAGHAPDHAVVKSHVDAISRVSKARHFVGFTNAVLRGVIRERENFDWLDAKEFPTKRAMAFGLGYPLWLVEEAQLRFGDRAQAVLKASNIPAPTCLRAIGNPDVLVEELNAAGIEASIHPKVPSAILVNARGKSGDLPWVKEGKAVIQDAASQAVVLACVDGLNAGDRGVDLCAAPGGKTLALAQFDLDMQANDQSEARLERLRTMADQFGLNIAIHVGDGRTFTPDDGPVDFVLLDAPCSGLGVMRRRPEIRWRRTQEDISALATLQGELLDHAVSILKPGGKLVYSVCTWTQGETDDVIAAFKQRHPNLTPVPIPVEVGQATARGVQLSPDVDQTDGMFIAAFTKA